MSIRPVKSSTMNGVMNGHKKSSSSSITSSTTLTTSSLSTSSSLSAGVVAPVRSIHQKQPISGLWWTAAAFIAFNHLVCFIALIQCYFRPELRPSRNLLLTTLLFAWLQLLGITAGYHRWASHSAYQPHPALKSFLALIGLMSFQGSIRWWSQRHRLHHRFTDHPEFDPHSAAKGMWHAHIGWLFTRPRNMTSKLQFVNMRDLDSDPVVRIQQRYLLIGYILFGAVMQLIIGRLAFGSAYLGFIWLGMFARLFSWHAIWSINSASHYQGEQEFAVNPHSSATNSWMFAIFQNGESNHNFHHAFASDYRHGIALTSWDPTKWCIWSWNKLGLAHNLRVTPQNQVDQARAEALLERAQQLKAKAIWPVADQALPSMTLSEFKSVQSSQALPWLIFHSLVLDVGHFEDHPGGDTVLRLRYGQDVTKIFEGGMNQHTQAAHRLAKMYAVAKIVQSDKDGESSHQS